MSEHDETFPDTGYDTPVPELDDHRHRSSAQRSERPRRGTFDSLYGARHLEPEMAIRIRDFEEAILDEDGDNTQPTPRHGRRPTIESSTDGRSISPPNSVKAFAEARRREREMSFSEAKDEGEEPLGRTMSNASHRSRRSYNQEADARSFQTNKTVEEDVCYPLQEKHPKQHSGRIDFEYLEDLIRDQQEEREERAARAELPTESFKDLRQTSTLTKPTQLVTVDGDILEAPSDDSVANEKTSFEGLAPPKFQPVDNTRFSFFSTAWESTIHAPEMGDLVLPGEDLRGLFELPEDEDGGVWWLNVNNPTKAEVYGMGKAFGLHPLTIEDIVTQEAREKIELFPSYYFACFRSFNVVDEPDGKEYEPFNIYVIVFREGTLSFSFTPNSHATDVRKRITSLKDYVSLSSDWICYALIDNIVDSFAPVINQIELEADAIEDEVFVMRFDDSNTFLRSIGRVRKNCMALLRLLGGKADVLRGFTKRCNENYQVTPHMDIGMYLGDIQDHVVTMATNLGHFEKILSRAHSNYLATLSINNISQGTDMNRVLSKITMLGSILVPLNLVCGLFGMNVRLPLEEVTNLGPFFGIVGFMVVLCAMMVSVARCKRWI
ncbi:hypothetical protein ACHAPV_008799 [Trichoderma viride]